MERVNTGYKDKNENMLFVGDEVFLEGELYEVLINDFNGNFVIDSDLGQGKLNDVCHMCIKKNVKRGEWIEGNYCKDCGGTVEYDFSLNKIFCDTCENEETEWM